MWGIIPKGWSVRRIWKYPWETGKQHFKLDKCWAVDWLLVNGGPEERQWINSALSASKQCPRLWALERAGRFSPTCLFVSVVPSLPLLCLLEDTPYLISGGKSSGPESFYVGSFGWIFVTLIFLWHMSVHLYSLGWRQGRGNPEINTLKGYPVTILCCCAFALWPKPRKSLNNPSPLMIRYI